jgi:hypothetical protein
MKRQSGDSAFVEVVSRLRTAWGSESTRRFIFPVFMKLGRNRKAKQ